MSCLRRVSEGPCVRGGVPAGLGGEQWNARALRLGLSVPAHGLLLWPGYPWAPLAAGHAGSSWKEVGSSFRGPGGTGQVTRWKGRAS